MNKKRTTALIAFSVVTASLGACKSNNSAADTAAARTDSAAGRVDSAAHTTAARTDSAVRADSAKNNTRSGWNDQSILGYTWAANTGEVRLGQLAEKKATNAKVKAYAREMVADHRTMESEAKTLAGKVKATADTTADNAKDLLNHGRDELKDLTDKAAGADWDKNFIDKMIDDHQHVLDKLQDAAKNTTNPDLRAALEKATGKVQQHLTKAQDIKNNVLKS
jgi:putative membrane protein